MPYDLYHNGRRVDSDWNRDRMIDRHFDYDDHEARFSLGCHGRAEYEDYDSCPTERYEVRHRDYEDDDY